MSPEDVRLRFVEAAEIEHRMHVKKGTSSGGNGWPGYRFDEEDMAGWDDAARLDNLEQWQGRKVTKSAEITRWEECYYGWTLGMLPKPADRRRVWIWARCIACGPSFVSVCDKQGWKTRTEYHRLERTFKFLAAQVSNNILLFWKADIPGLAHRNDVGSIVHDIETARVTTKAQGWRAADAVLADHPEIRDFSWSDAQVSRHARKLLNSGKVASGPDTSIAA